MPDRIRSMETDRFSRSPGIPGSGGLAMGAVHTEPSDDLTLAIRRLEQTPPSGPLVLDMPAEEVAEAVESEDDAVELEDEASEDQWNDEEIVDVFRRLGEE